MDDEEYRRMRAAEDLEHDFTDCEDSSQHTSPDEADEDALYDLGYPEEPQEEDAGPHDSDRHDFVVILPEKIIRIAQDSHLSWLTLFYALPRELVEKRPVYLELPRRMDKIANSERFTDMILDDTFLELVCGTAMPGRSGRR